MTARADPLDTLVEYRVDPEAEPGNVVPALARLLIDLARRRSETSGPAMAAHFSGSIPSDSPSQEAPHDKS